MKRALKQAIPTDLVYCEFHATINPKKMNA
jgi:hypothetical protein